MTLRHAPWPTGTPCWADLSVPEVDAACEFYAAVLGWTFDERAAGGYAYASVGGADVAAIRAQDAAGLPAFWLLYFATDDVGAATDAIRARGGGVVAGPADAGASGRYVVARDPAGAAFALWQAREHIGAHRVNEPGALTWEDLRSSEPEAVQDFYADLLGLHLRPVPGVGDSYRTFHLPGDAAPLGGMGGRFGADEPSHWVVYFAVADVDATVAAAVAAGGAAVGPASDTPFGRLATLTDRDGAAFVVMAPNAPPPDRTG